MVPQYEYLLSFKSLMKELILHPSLTAVIIGLVSGMAAGLLENVLLKLSISDTISKQNAAGGTLVPLQVVRYALLAIPLLAACLFPEYVSLLGAFAGEMISKLVLFFCETAASGSKRR